MAEPKKTLTAEEFRSSLQDVVAVLERLAPHCPRTEQLMEVCRIALESDSQLELLISLMLTGNKK